MSASNMCENCVHFPICEWCDENTEFNLPEDGSNCDMYHPECQERSEGEWKPCYEDWRKQIEGSECSICSFQHYGTSIKHYHYCPNCGARMTTFVTDINVGGKEESP